MQVLYSTELPQVHTRRQQAIEIQTSHSGQGFKMSSMEVLKDAYKVITPWSHHTNKMFKEIHKGQLPVRTTCSKILIQDCIAAIPELFDLADEHLQ